MSHVALVADGGHGVIRRATRARSSSGATANDFRYTGQQQDADANRGLYYLRARAYDPSLGRFLQKDRLPLLQRYAYVGNNPATYVDPSGLCGLGSLGDVGDCGKKIVDTAAKVNTLVDNAPVTIPAVAWGVAHGGSCGIDGDLFIVCSGMDGGYGRGGTTVGSVFLTGLSAGQLRKNPDLLAHEKRHALQWQLLGPVGFPALYYLNEGLGAMLPGPSYCWNMFERDAGLKAGGYDCGSTGQVKTKPGKE